MQISASNGLNPNTVRFFARKTSKLIMVGGVVMGTIFIAVGLLFYKFIQIDGSWKRVQGKVVGAEQHTSTNTYSSNYGNSNTITNQGVDYTPVIEYTVNNTKYRITSIVSSNTIPAIGSTRQIGYNPSNPAQAKVVEGPTSKLIAIIFPLAGLGAIIISIVSYFSAKKSLAPLPASAPMEEPAAPPPAITLVSAAAPAPAPLPTTPAVPPENQQKTPPSAAG